MTPAGTYLLRLRLPDQPGTLGLVASALGAAGADIESIVVVDRATGYAVDDLVVSLPGTGLADRLVTAVTSVPGVVVETVQRHHGRVRVHDELALLDLAAASPSPLASLVDGLPTLLHASYALLVGQEASVASPSAPRPPDHTSWLPPASGREVRAEELWDDPAVAGPDCELVAVPFATRSALVLGRIGGPGFRPAELMLLAHLASVACALLPATPSLR